MHDILCYHLTEFTPTKVSYLLPLLAFNEIQFQNNYEPILEEAFTIMVIYLSYPTQY